MPQKKVSATINVTAVIDGQDGQPGAEGNGMQSVTRTYAVSSQATTASDTTPPSDVTAWAAASPATTESKPYLWAKEVVIYTKAASTTKFYMIGARGQNGIDAQDVEWAYIRTKTNTPPVIADSAGIDSNGVESWDDDYLPSAYVSLSGTGHIETNNIGPSDHPDTYNNYACGECTDDPKGVNDTWPYEWEIKREKGAADSNGHRAWQPYSGTMTLHNNLAASLLTIDIDNDSDQFGVDADGKVLAQQARSTVVTMAYGTELQAFTAAPTASLRYDDGTTVPTTVATAAVAVVANTDSKQYRVTVTVKATGTNTPVFGTSGKNGLYVDISGTCAKGGPKTIRFSLNKVMGGASGQNPVIWQLNPSRKSFVFGRDASNNLTPASVASSIYVTRTVGNTTTEHTGTSGLTNPPTFSWGFDNLATAQASGQAIGTAISISSTQAASHSSVWVKLSTGDRETLSILKDGQLGAEGNGIQSVTRTYAVSSQATTASDTTPPSDITTWAAASPATTVEKPYLWAKEVVTYTKAATTTKYYMIGARGQNGIDAQDFEWAYIRTKTNTAPVIAADSSYTDSKGKAYTADDHLPHVTGNANIESDNSGVSGKTYECTDDPKGVNDTWPYEWEIKREKGTADANGHRAWTAYSGKMALHNMAAHSVSPNILLRTIFDRGIDFVLEAWRRNSDNYAVIDTASDTVVNGRRSIRLDAMNNGNDVYFYQSLLGKLKANTWYSLSFNAFIANGGGNLIVSLYNLFGGTRTNIFGNGLKVILDGEDYQVGNDGNNDVLITGGWDGKRHTITFLTNSSISAETLNLQFYQAYGSGTGNHSISCICMPKLEEGRVATAYMAHEDDLEGDAAEVYSLQCTPTSVNFRSNAVGEFYGSYTVGCKVMKTVGNNTTEVAASSGTYDGMYLKLRKLNTSGNYTSWNAASSATLTPSDALTNNYVAVEFALSANSGMTDVKARVSVPIMCDGHRGAPGEPGATGKMFYPMGAWNAQTTYSRTGDLVPLVFLPDPGNYNETIGAEGHYFYLYDDTNIGTRPVVNDSTNPWRLCDTFGVVITQGLFAEFAKMGKGIFSGDYFFSMNGRIFTSATNSIEKTAGATYTYNGVTKPAYTWFKGDPSEQTTYPYFEPNWWVDLLTGKMSAARGNFVVDADGSVVATNGTFEGLLRARSMETMFADLTDKYRKDNNAYVALNGDSGSPGEYILGEDVYEMVGNSYVKVDITGIYNFVVGNTVFILPADNAFISKRVLLYNGNVNSAGGTSKGVRVETYKIDEGMTTARYLKGVGKDVKYDTNTSVPSDHVLPPRSAVPLWSFDPVSKLFFVNGVVELIAVPDTDDATLCDWSVVNIGTNCYLLD